VDHQAIVDHQAVVDHQAIVDHQTKAASNKNTNPFFYFQVNIVKKISLIQKLFL
jgi:hypothetical protein